MSKQQTLFPLEEIPENPNYISPSEKRKWTIEFEKWCFEKYLSEGHLHGTFCCGCMRICDYCDFKKQDGCKDCVEAIKEIYRLVNKPIPYKNYNFDEILKEVQGND